MPITQGTSQLTNTETAVPSASVGFAGNLNIVFCHYYTRVLNRISRHAICSIALMKSNITLALSEKKSWANNTTMWSNFFLICFCNLFLKTQQEPKLLVSTMKRTFFNNCNILLFKIKHWPVGLLVRLIN